jgi:hypothetical protein
MTDVPPAYKPLPQETILGRNSKLGIIRELEVSTTRIWTCGTTDTKGTRVGPSRHSVSGAVVDDPSPTMRSILTKDGQSATWRSRHSISTNGMHYNSGRQDGYTEYWRINGQFTHFLHCHTCNLFIERLYK